MTNSNEKNVMSIDAAINECNDYIAFHRKYMTRLLIVLLELGFLAVVGGFYLFAYRGIYETAPQQSTLMTTVVTGILILISILIGVLVSLYRFHLLEIARTEHYKIGFMRIRVAANNASAGFQTEVRKSLTEGAFQFETAKTQKSERIESPMPGHPTSDFSALLLNKIIDGFEVVAKPKKSSAAKDES
ncbi:MAG TPA: hypothetical protein VIU93_04385 [Gallionellaceae bacterium]